MSIQPPFSLATKIVHLKRKNHMPLGLKAALLDFLENWGMLQPPPSCASGQEIPLLLTRRWRKRLAICQCNG
ncbi:MAG: hypothetical protein JRI89_14365 [Deltaproteobacteria bacterium]|nr:hypothetical protein [Deltaproteobacteria bacterium]